MSYELGVGGVGVGVGVSVSLNRKDAEAQPRSIGALRPLRKLSVLAPLR